MMRTCVAALLGLVMSAGTAAAQCTVPNTLANNTNADATQVMANFNALATCINNISPTSAPPGTIVPFSGAVLPTGWLWANGAAVSRTTYAALWAVLGKADAVTITIASPAVVTWTSGAHGLANDWPVKFYSTGALPTGLVAGQTYYVKSATTNTFRLALAPGAADINTSGSQSGTQTGVFAPYGNGDNATTFNLPCSKQPASQRNLHKRGITRCGRRRADDELHYQALMDCLRIEAGHVARAVLIRTSCWR